MVESISCSVSAPSWPAARTRSVTRSSPGGGPLAGEQPGQVPGDGRRGGHGRGRRLGRRGRGEQRGEPGPELVPVWSGDAEQLADHGERQREGEAGDQVDDGLAVRFEVVQQPVGDRLDPWPEGGDPRPAERRGGQPAQPGVVGRVGAEHVPGEGGAGQALGDHRAVPGQRGVHVLGQAGVGEGGPGLLVPDDQPGAVPVGQGDLVHRAVGLDAGEQRVRVVSVVAAPRVEGRVAHLDHP
jgi:hypothetical protein